jgi:hypothetical protein
VRAGRRGDDNRLCVHDFNSRHNAATEEREVSPPKVRSAKRILKWIGKGRAVGKLLPGFSEFRYLDFVFLANALLQFVEHQTGLVFFECPQFIGWKDDLLSSRFFTYSIFTPIVSS